ncbi:MAG: T9SS type A sorting domain-containing protein [Bacteroidia bacterium]|nr:T9SS type A sorting domain-containing protein [Bacteroidia bacterium]
MKTKLLTTILLLVAFTLQAQVTLDKKYDYSTSVVKFETLGYKYFLMDVPNAQCRIYNTDHSLLKAINCNVPSGYFLYDIKFLSEKLFDSDSGIELLCTFYKYYSTQNYYEYDSKIINDDGSELLFIDGSLYNYINKTGENEYKLFSYCYDFSVFPEKVWTNIYHLAGLPVASALNFANSPDIFMNAFPNPASQSLKVAYTLPDKVTLATLHLIDNSGKQVGQFMVDNHTDHLMLDVSRYQSGVYHYFIEFGNTKTPAKKLVVQ